MIGTIYANSVSDSERTGQSAVHGDFRNLGKGIEYVGESVNNPASRISPQNMLRTSASSPRNQPSSPARSHSSGSCSPADTSTKTKNLTPFSHRGRRLGETKSPGSMDEQMINEQHHQSQHHLSSAASADEDVFHTRARQSASPIQKLSDDTPGLGPSRLRIRSKESISSGAHGCDHRTGSPLDRRERIHSDTDRGPRENSFTGSVRLTLKQKSEDLPDDVVAPQKIRTLSTRTNSSTDEFPAVIRAHSKAVSYESICLKIKEELTENPKTIQVISLCAQQPSNLFYKAAILEQAETTCSPDNSCGPPCSASQSFDVLAPEAISSGSSTQKDHSTKHRSTVFFSSKKSNTGSHSDLRQLESANLPPIEMIVSLPSKLIKQNSADTARISALGQPSKISELLNQNRSEIIALNKGGEPQKLTTISRAEYGDESLLTVVPAGETSSHFDVKASTIHHGKESMFFLNRDQQPSSSQLIMGTVFTDRRNNNQKLLFPGTDFVQRDNSDSKASQNSRPAQQLEDVHNINVVNPESRLSQNDRIPERFDPSCKTDVTNGPLLTNNHFESTRESTTVIGRKQGPSSGTQPIRNLLQLDSDIVTPARRNPTVTKHNHRGSDGKTESLLVCAREEKVTGLLSEDKRSDKTVKPEAEVVSGRFTNMRSIASLEINEENSSTISSSTTASFSSAKSAQISTALSSIPAKKAQNTSTVSQESTLSPIVDGSHPVQASTIDSLRKVSPEKGREASGQSFLSEGTRTDLGVDGLAKTAEKEKTRRFVRFESEDELLLYSPKEVSPSSSAYTTPSDVLSEMSCPLLRATEFAALGASMTGNKPEMTRSPQSPSVGDSHLKTSKIDSDTVEYLLPKAPTKDPETLEDLFSKSPKKDPEASKDDPSKTSPSAGRALPKPCIVRKQLVHLDSALHPSSCVPPEAKPVESRWSPKLVRKLNLAEAKDVDVSDLDVAPDLLDFLSKQMEKVSIETKQPEPPCETLDEDRDRGLPALSAQRIKPPLSLPLKPTEREEENALPLASASAAGNDAVKPEAEVGKRKFFSALKANAASFRAKKVTGADDPSPDKKSNLDRLASFAIISDVGIATKRRQFQQKKESSSSLLGSSNRTDPTTDAHAKLLSLESPPSRTSRAQTKDDSSASLSSNSSGRNDDANKIRRRLGESETRLGTNRELKTRLGRPEVDSSDDDFDRLVEINFRQLVDGSQSGGPEEAMELLKGDKTQTTGTGLAGTRGTVGVRDQQKGVQGTRRQLSRFKTQPVTPVEVEKAREMALHPNKSSEN